MLAYKVSKDRRVQEYVGAHGDRKIRYCSHSLTDENTIDGNGFNWGENGVALCKESIANGQYYCCYKYNHLGYFQIAISDSPVKHYLKQSGGPWGVSGANYRLDTATNRYVSIGSNVGVGSVSDASSWYSDNLGSWNGSYGTGEEIINADTGWSEWEYSGEQGPQGPAGQSWITSIEENSDGTYTLIITPSPTNVTSPT
jgi:hypothetical protein